MTLLVWSRATSPARGEVILESLGWRSPRVMFKVKGRERVARDHTGLAVP